MARGSIASKNIKNKKKQYFNKICAVKKIRIELIKVYSILQYIQNLQYLNRFPNIYIYKLSSVLSSKSV